MVPFPELLVVRPYSPNPCKSTAGNNLRSSLVNRCPKIASVHHCQTPNHPAAAVLLWHFLDKQVPRSVLHFYPAAPSSAPTGTADSPPLCHHPRRSRLPRTPSAPDPEPSTLSLAHHRPTMIVSSGQPTVTALANTPICLGNGQHYDLNAELGGVRYGRRRNGCLIQTPLVSGGLGPQNGCRKRHRLSCDRQSFLLIVALCVTSCDPYYRVPVCR